jgi:YidC/Oxa1 family membrane protein insertase
MISDWSGVAIEYAFALEKPVLYVDIPKKINNHDYNDLEIVPLEEKIRSQIGTTISPLELSNLSEKIENLCLNIDQNRKKIQAIREETVFNLGKSEKYGSKYLLEFLERKNED